MKTNESPRRVTAEGVTDSASFEISSKDSTHLMTILRDNIYSDKVLAVLREYSANAWDAQRSVGKRDQPIEVTVPTRGHPTLKIRDHGPGLSRHDVLRVYTQYGASTKRDDDETVGHLGIGSKSAFCYSDSFTITSWHQGTKAIYVAVLDETNRGTCSLVHEEPCGDETGIEIQIAVRREDCPEFEQKAIRLFSHFRPRPTINVDLPAIPPEETSLKTGTIRKIAHDGPGAGEWIAVMGCIPYRVNLDQLPTTKLRGALRKMSGTLQFPIGGVHFSASREELKYSQHTKDALIAKFDELIDEFVEQALDLIESDKISWFEKRLRMRVLDELDLPIPKEHEVYAGILVKLVVEEDDQPKPFVVLHGRAAVGSVSVTPDLRVVLDDSGRRINGYDLGQDDYVVRPIRKRQTTEVLRAALVARLEAVQLTGVPIVLASTLNWVARGKTRTPAGQLANAKHKLRHFVLSAMAPGKAPYSRNWEPIERTPQADDVFVIIEGFRPQSFVEDRQRGESGFFRDHSTDKQLASALGEPFPRIYGYKSTEAKPVLPSECQGTEYDAWSKTWRRGLVNPERRELLEHYYWSKTFCPNYYEDRTPGKKQRDRIAKKLGPDHPIVALIQRAALGREAVKAAKKGTDLRDGQLDLIAYWSGLSAETFGCEVPVAELETRYPLLRHGRGLQALWRADDHDVEPGEVKEWLEYIQLVDIARPVATMTATPIQKDDNAALHAN